jgi:hypothetical protein
VAVLTTASPSAEKERRTSFRVLGGEGVFSSPFLSTASPSKDRDIRREGGAEVLVVAVVCRRSDCQMICGYACEFDLLRFPALDGAVVVGSDDETRLSSCSSSAGFSAAAAAVFCELSA